MKLSEILARILIDVDLRLNNRDKGLCSLVDDLTAGDPEIHDQFKEARKACTQTATYVYPVRPTNCLRPGQNWVQATRAGGMWRGEYGCARRKFLRDALHWARENGL